MGGCVHTRIQGYLPHEGFNYQVLQTHLGTHHHEYPDPHLSA